MLTHQYENEQVGTAEAYRYSAWVYGAINAIAGTVAHQPFVIRRVASNDIIASGDLYRLIENPNRYDQQNTSSKFRYAYLVELLLNGAVMRLLTGLHGHRPTGMVTFPRWRFRIEERPDELGIYMPWRCYYAGRMGAGGVYIVNDEIYHDALFNPYHEWEGLSPLQAAIIGINNDVDSGEFAHRYYKNDSSTGVVFTSEHPGFRQKQAEEAQAWWQQKFGGLRSAYKAKFLGYGLKPHDIGQPFDAEAHRVLKALTKEEIITGIYRIPLEIFGAEQATAGVQIGDSKGDTAQESFLVNVIQPWARRYDQEFTADVVWRFAGDGLGDVVVEHDFTNHPILEKRKLERARVAVELVDRGIPMNEVVRWLKLQLEPTAWGNEWWVPSNMVPASVIHAAGDRVLFDDSKRASPSNAGAKPGKPGVRDNRGHPAADRSQALNDYVDEILRLAGTVQVRNLAREQSSANGYGGRLAALIKGEA